MNEKEYLNEEKYQKNIKKIKKIALTILIIGILIGGSVIGVGVSKQLKVNEKYSDENKAELQKKIDAEKKKLEDKKSELQSKIVELEKNRDNALAAEKKKLEDEKSKLKAKGIKYNTFAKYEDGDEYKLLVVTDALDPSFSYCSFDKCKNHDLTKKYCSMLNKEDEYTKNIKLVNEDIAFIDETLSSTTHNCTFANGKEKDLISNYCSYKDELDELNNEVNKQFDSGDSVPFYMFGAFIIIATCIVSGSVYMISKRREIAAFSVQQMNPIAKEHIESMGTSIGKAMANAVKEINPEYKSLKCPNCGASIDGNEDIEKCDYCGETLVKVGRFK